MTSTFSHKEDYAFLPKDLRLLFLRAIPHSCGRDSTMRRNFTVVLTDEEAHEVSKLLSVFGGSVGGFAASLVRDFIQLTPQQIVTVRQQIQHLCEENQRAKAGRTD